eukprot:scaffold5371_cov190-Skeletonema_marinoi.AAC.2
MTATTNRRRIHIACRTLSFLISTYIFTVNLYSQIELASFNASSSNAIQKNTTTQIKKTSFNDYLIEYMKLTTPLPLPTLTYYDPHLMGGFRNQHMRFVAFVNKAVEHNISQLLLPSLRWGDVSQPGWSVGHEVLFDVVYWNRRAGEFGLPRLVRYEADVLERNGGGREEVIPCFNVSSSMYSGLNEKKWRNKGIVLRQHSLWDYLGEPSKYAHCKHQNFDSHKEIPNGPMTYLVPHGGTKASGRLWWEYDAMQRHRSKPDELTGKYPDHLPIEQAVYKLLIPSPPIRRAIRESLDEAIGTSNINKPTVVALHPRIEHDMLLHDICNEFMQLNLTKIFDSIRIMPKFDLLFVAVSKALVDGKPPDKMNRYKDLMRIALENKIVLNQARNYGVFGSKDQKGIPMLESGTSTTTKIEFPIMEQRNSNGLEVVTAKSLRVTELVASVVNFFTALEADAFVGVRGSTFSQDVFSVRYYQHQDRGDGVGENNFVVGPNGMRQLFGPAEPLPCK